MSTLEDFYKRVLEDKRITNKNSEVNIMNNPYINIDVFKRTIHNINDMEPSNIIAFINANIDQIATDIINNDIEYVGFITSYKFLDAFINVMNRIDITYNRRLCCNKLAYDYSTLTDNIDPNIKSKLITLSGIVNKTIINQLMELGINMNDACNIAICRYSSSNERVNSERLNFILCKMDSKIITLQNVIYIYEILYDKISDLFSGIMFETYTEDEEDDLGDEFMNNYSTISLAILNIINNMTTREIQILIKTYVDDWNYKRCPNVRFSMRSISNDYSRISNVVESMMNNNIYIP